MNTNYKETVGTNSPVHAMTEKSTRGMGEYTRSPRVKSSSKVRDRDDVKSTHSGILKKTGKVNGFAKEAMSNFFGDFSKII